MIEGKKKTKTIHHDRLKPCKDASFPLWLQRKRHNLLSDNTFQNEQVSEDSDITLPFELMEDAPFDDLFDPHATLPYMLGDREPLENSVQSLRPTSDMRNTDACAPGRGDRPNSQIDIPNIDLSGVNSDVSIREVVKSDKGSEESLKLSEVIVSVHKD